ncbi:MAG: 16S rRNA (cytosine(1402)-N(4))-methyltransferase RsmH [bacterium]|nr:16S rRNA (cytosine(1402)-N(4))-methyltransferase RsmH [bacterium]MDT8395290.1 16S rRNA (cytosine(1402)-N(4))-methyltransferase RsmH [bacterium]
MEATGSHFPVLLEEILEGLNIRQGGVYLDGTVGAGGHADALLSRYSGTRLIGLDRDPAALEAAGARLAVYGDRVILVHRDFRFLSDALDETGTGVVDGIILDLGVSSMQLDQGDRGFSFTHDGPLDMRMDPGSGSPASELVNGMDPRDLANLLFRYGEERRSRAIAAAIARARDAGPVETTARLASIVAAVPGMGRIRNIHPATRTFQALRIAVNDELAAVEDAVPAGVGRLAPGGRMAVISFHSLEDRIVKRGFKGLEKPCRCPKEMPECRCGLVSAGKVITRRPIVPTEREARENPRSRSAKLRVFEKKQ